MSFTREQFSRRATRDLRSAMSLALSRALEGLRFAQPTMGGPFQFSAVFDEWPRYEDKYIPPAACITPTDWSYSDPRLVPALIPGTWEPKDSSGNPLGFPGFGLYATADLDASWNVSIRCASAAQREAVIKGIEEAFTSVPTTGDLMALSNRYGTLLAMPEYYGMSARFALTAGRVVDDEDRAMRNQREAVLTFAGQAKQVAVGPVRPLKIVVTEIGSEGSIEQAPIPTPRTGRIRNPRPLTED